MNLASIAGVLFWFPRKVFYGLIRKLGIHDRLGLSVP
jgi:hypothetical protein